MSKRIFPFEQEVKVPGGATINVLARGCGGPLDCDFRVDVHPQSGVVLHLDFDSPALEALYLKLRQVLRREE